MTEHEDLYDTALETVYDAIRAYQADDKDGVHEALGQMVGCPGRIPTPEEGVHYLILLEIAVSGLEVVSAASMLSLPEAIELSHTSMKSELEH